MERLSNILITFGTHPFAQRIRQQIPDIPTYLASSEQIPDLMLASGHYFSIPDADASHFLHELLKLALHLEISTLLPLGLREGKMLMEGKVLFEEYGIRLLLPEHDVFMQMNSLINPPRGLALELTSNGVMTYNDEQEVFICFAVD